MSNDIAPVSPMPSGDPSGEHLEALDLSWSQPRGMIGLSVKNFLYRIITLGIYHFWGKAEVRKRIWSGVRINGEPLQYTGTGKELFLGFLFVLVILSVPTLLLTIAAFLAVGERGANLVQGVLTVLFFYLIGVGFHRAIRYRMSRTTWRGIRGGLAGDSWKYGWTYFWTGIVMAVTLGWAAPWRAVKLQSLITNGLRFGDRPFHFTASAGPLYPAFAVLWLSAIAIMALIGFFLFAMWAKLGVLLQVSRPGQSADPAVLFGVIVIVYGSFIVGFLLFSIVSSWYRAKMMNQFAAHTTFEHARFSGTATGRSLIWLSISNLLMVIFTLGLLGPVAQARYARYFVQRLRINGSAALDRILQGAEYKGRGEGLAQAFDIDAF